MPGHGRPTVICNLFALALAMVAIGSPTRRLYAQEGFVSANATDATSSISDRENSENLRNLRQRALEFQDESTQFFQIRFDSPSWPIVGAAEKGPLQVSVKSLVQYAGRKLTLQYKLIRAEDGEMIVREQTDVNLDSNGSCPPVILQAQAPSVAGVYEIQIRLFENSDRLWSKLTRDRDQVAVTQMPWMIYELPAWESSDESKASAEAASNRGSSWKPPQPIQQIDPNEIEALNWIPERATNLVPGVRRVTSEWTLTPWQDDEESQGDAEEKEVVFTGRLPKSRPHRMHRITMAFDWEGKTVEQSNAVIEFSLKPDFSVVTRSVPFSFQNSAGFQDTVSVQKGEGDTSDRSSSSFELFHFPSDGQEFVRVRFVSSSRILNVSSCEIAESAFADMDAGRKVPLAQRERRRMILDLGRSDWASQLTYDYSPGLNADKLSASTIEMFRLYKATGRLTGCLSNIGFTHAFLPIDGGEQCWFYHPQVALTGLDGKRQSYVDSLRLSAVLHWNQHSAVTLVPKMYGEFAFQSEMGSEGDNADSRTDPSMAFSDVSADQLRKLLVDLTEMHGGADVFTEIALDLTRHRLSIQALDRLAENCPVSLSVLGKARRTARLVAEYQSGLDGKDQRGWEFLVADAEFDGPEGNQLGDHMGPALAPLIRRLCDEDPSQVVLRSETLNLALPITTAATFFEVANLPLKSQSISSSGNEASDFVMVLSHEAGIVMVNRSPWTTDVTVGSSKDDQQIVKLKPLEVKRLNLETLDPQSLLRQGRFQWSARPSGNEAAISAIKSQLGEIVGRLGTLSQPRDYDELINGGFEQKGQVGVVGWMHTQFPETAVKLDADEVLVGEHSICLTTDQKSSGRTWLVSSPIPVPDSGRLAVSLAARSAVPPTLPVSASADRAAMTPEGFTDAKEGKSQVVASQRVRFSLEGDRLGRPVRFAAEFDLPSDGEWHFRKIVLETDQLDPSSMDSVRLTIDSLSPGRLWIDDVHLHDHFATDAERKALQGQAFLAIQGLQHGQLLPAAELLQNRWASHLLVAKPEPWPSQRTSRDHEENRSDTTQNHARLHSRANSSKSNAVDADAGSSSTKSPSKTTAASKKRETVADRIRDWLPRSLKF